MTERRPAARPRLLRQLTATAPGVDTAQDLHTDRGEHHRGQQGRRQPDHRAQDAEHVTVAFLVAVGAADRAGRR